MPRPRRSSALLVALLIGACTQPPPQMYVMSGVDQGRAATPPPDPVVAIVRVQMPDYLDRPEIVSRKGANNLEIAQNDRWGEPLSESVPRILAQNLSHYIKGGRVVLPTEGRGQQLPYEYLVVLDAYEPNSDGQAVMRGHWRLRDLHGGKVLAEGLINEAHPAELGDYPAMVHALNEDLNSSSEQMAQATEGTVGRPR